jgi:coenzyme F420-reducing hydrogenase delta subunit
MNDDIKIVGFVCKFCAMLSFDLGSQSQYSAKYKLIELPCAGRIDARAILAAFERGADGVFIAGCPTHECMNITGSQRAGKRIERVKQLLEVTGLGNDRLVMYYVNGTDGPRLTQIVTEMTALAVQAGPNPLKTHIKEEL